MTDHAQKQSTADGSDFARLWQEKWAEMLRQNGWPDGMALPGFGAMPFTLPFMAPFGGASDTQAMLARIAALESRVSALEKTMAQRSTTRRKKAAPKA